MTDPHAGDHHAQQRRRWSPALLVVLLAIVAGTGLRFWHIGADDFWLDELLSMQTSTGRGWESQALPTDQWIEHAPPMARITPDAPWWQIWPSMSRQEEMPPLYFLMLRGWRALFGDGEAAVRSLSAIAGVLGLVLAARAGAILYGSGGAARTAVLAAVAPMAVAMSQEARPYTWAVLFCLAALLAVLHMRQHGIGPWNLLALGACTYLAVLTHYFAVGPIAAVLLFGLLALRGRPRRWPPVAAAAAAAAVYALTWGPVFLAQRANLLTHAAEDVATGRTPGQFLAETGYALTFQWVPTLTGWPQLIAAVTMAAALLTAAWRARRDISMAAGPIWFACWLAMMITVDLATGSQTMTVARYGTLAGPGLFLTVAGPLSPRRHGLRNIVAAVVALACLCSLSAAYQRDRGPWRQTAEAMATVTKPGDVLAVVATRSPRWWLGRTLVGLSYYTPGGVWPGPVVLLTKPPAGALLARLRRSPDLWIVTDTSTLRPPDLIPGTVATGQRRVEAVAMIYRARWTDPATTPASSRRTAPSSLSRHLP